MTEPPDNWTPGPRENLELDDAGRADWWLARSIQTSRTDHETAMEQAAYALTYAVLDLSANTALSTMVDRSALEDDAYRRGLQAARDAHQASQPPEGTDQPKGKRKAGRPRPARDDDPAPEE